MAGRSDRRVLLSGLGFAEGPRWRDDACALGGPDRRTLFVLVADAYSGEAIRGRPAAIEMLEVDVPGAGWP